MTPSALIANSLWLGSSLPGFLRFQRALHHPARVQERLLSHYISRNAETAFGKAHGFGKIQNHRDYSKQVPLVDYDVLQPWITGIAAGESSVLTMDPVTHLIPTSGSTGGRKLIPFTAGLQNEINAAIAPWICDLNVRYPSIGLGNSYWSVSPAANIREKESSVVPIGFDEDSSYLGGTRKRIVNALMAVPPEIRLIGDIERFRYATLLCLIRQPDLRLISIWHPSFLTLLLDALTANWNDLLMDVRRGGCKYGERFPAALVAGFRPWPSRAAQLEQADPLNPKSIWPHLQLISCWGDGHASGALNDLKRRFPGVGVQPKGLLATEAFITLPFRGFYPVAVCSHFFEFFDDDGGVHLVHELAEGAEYEVAVTTGGGLYRYRMGDRIKVTGFLSSTPSLKFLGRNGNYSDRCGEKLSEAFVGRAIQEATNSSLELPCFAMLAPEVVSDGVRYTLFIEGQIEDGLEKRLDAALKQNPHYLYCRNLGQLQEPGILEIAGGGFETYAAREMLRGRRLGDIKPSPLSPHVDWAEHFQTKSKLGIRLSNAVTR
jgi:hypothetical protein